MDERLTAQNKRSPRGQALRLTSPKSRPGPESRGRIDRLSVRWPR